MAEAEKLKIERIGAKGHGVAMRDGEPVYVPFALPGEEWARGGDGFHLVANANPERVTPICRHFMQCGGCLPQHMSPGGQS